MPEFTSGDECLFCHRNDVGPGWATNRHGRTVRDLDPKADALAALTKEVAGQVKLVLGGANRVRFLKPGKDHGKLDLLTAEWSPKEGKLLHADKPHWDAKAFGDGCAGCHATGIDARKRTFAAISLDCYVCHGLVPDKHTKDGSLAYLSPRRKDEPRVVTSLCAQCHVRTGTAKSTSLPYPNNFVPGDNLFLDFRADFSDDALKAANPADAHILANVRDVVARGKEEVTCLSCHAIHKPSGKRHHQVADGPLCLHCHNEKGPKKERKPIEVHSKVCGY